MSLDQIRYWLSTDNFNFDLIDTLAWVCLSEVEGIN